MPDIGSNGKVAPCLGLFTIAAFSCSMVASFSCEFIGNTVTAAFPLFPNFPSVPTEYSYGIWQAKYAGGDCTSYSWNVPDQVTAAQVMVVLTTIIGFILMIVGCVVVCIPFPAMMFKSLGVAYFFTTLFEGLKFLFVLDSDTKPWKGYSLEYGANCCIAATCLWFVAMLMSCAVKPRRDDDDDDNSPKEVEESAKEEEPKNEEDENTDEEPKNEEEAKPDEDA